MAWSPASGNSSKGRDAASPSRSGPLAEALAPIPTEPVRQHRWESPLSLLTLSRWQFAITIMFHMIFPSLTVGTSILLCVLYGMYWRNGKAVYLQMFRFWRRIFAVGFAIGVVAGIVVTFEFGLDWGVFAA